MQINPLQQFFAVAPPKRVWLQSQILQHLLNGAPLLLTICSTLDFGYEELPDGDMTNMDRGTVQVLATHIS